MLHNPNWFFRGTGAVAPGCGIHGFTACCAFSANQLGTLKMEATPSVYLATVNTRTSIASHVVRVNNDPCRSGRKPLLGNSACNNALRATSRAGAMRPPRDRHIGARRHPMIQVTTHCNAEWKPRLSRITSHASESMMNSRRLEAGGREYVKTLAELEMSYFSHARSHVLVRQFNNYWILLRLLNFSSGFDSLRPLHFSSSGVSLRCPRTLLSLSPRSHSLDAATTVPLIECVDRPLGRVRSRWSHPSVIGRVEMWRGGRRCGLSVAASFVWRCPSTLTVTPFPHPAHRTGLADRPHPALGQNITPSPTTGRGQAVSDGRARSARTSARVDRSRLFCA
jgi:hypothetical protein